jgi:hypothetical protein
MARTLDAASKGCQAMFAVHLSEYFGNSDKYNGVRSAIFEPGVNLSTVSLLKCLEYRTLIVLMIRDCFVQFQSGSNGQPRTLWVRPL